MPYGTITVNTKTYEPRIPGTYVLSSVTFGQPTNEFRIRGAVLSKDGLLRASIVRVLEKDVVVGSDTKRKQCTVTTAITAPPSDFTAAELDALLSDSSEFATGATLSRLLQGES